MSDASEPISLPALCESGDDENVICVICQEDICPGEPTTSTPCSHIFHFNCFLRSAQSSDVCPTCRANMYSDSDENNNDETRNNARSSIEIEIPVSMSGDVTQETIDTIRRGISRLATARMSRNTNDDDDDDDNDEDFVITEDNELRQSRLVYTILQSCVNGNIDSVRRIIADNRELCSARDDDNDTLLHAGVLSDNETLVRYLVNELSIPINSHNSDRCTPLHYAVFTKSLRTTTLLLNAGAFIDCQDAAGRTPLMLACQNNDSDIVQLLLDRGASVRCFDLCGENALHHASRNKCLSCIRHLIRNTDCELISKNNFEETALHIACGTGSHTSVRFLLEAGADPDAKTKFGKTPSDYISRDNARLRTLVSSHMR